MSTEKPTLLARAFKYMNCGSNNYRFFVVVNYTSWSCFLWHALLIIGFTLIGVPVLAIVNIASSIIFILCFWVNRKGYHQTSLFLGIFEVIMHTVIAVRFLGWDSGFQYFIPCLVPLIFFAPKLHNTIRILLTALFCSIYIFLSIYIHSIAPIISLSNATLSALYYINIMSSFAAFAILGYFYSFASNKTEESLKIANKELEDLAFTDPLTGLFNRRNLLQEIEHSIESSKMNGKPFSIILADIDNFKHFNDKYGHECGDFILVSISNLIRDIIQTKSKIARWGGEEFMIILPGKNYEQCREIAEELRQNICNSKLSYNDVKISISMTFGICEYNGSMNVQEIIKNADMCLYKGKHSGKNCVVG